MRMDYETSLEVAVSFISDKMAAVTCVVRKSEVVKEFLVFSPPQDTNDNDASPEFRLREAASLQQQRHLLSPQSLLAASMAAAPPSLVPLPGLTGLTGYGGGGVGRAGSVSPPAREAASPPTSSSAGHSPRQPSAATGTPNGAAAQAPWNYEEQFKQVSPYPLHNTHAILFFKLTTK